MTRQTEKYASVILADPRWISIVSRDPKADGHFYYSVRTTGVYCRPSCGSRAPRPENVSFFLSTKEAEHAGFRPCKRCKPQQQSQHGKHNDLIVRLCRQIESASTPPSLQTLAEAANMSPFHLHRLFKAATGVTPRAYAAAQRAKKVRKELSRQTNITNAIYEAGYNSNGRFYEDSAKLLGMTPKNFRSGGTNTTIRFAIGECSLGSILVAASTRGICAISLGDNPDILLQELQDRFSNADLIGGDKEFELMVAKVISFVETPKHGLNLPLDIQGTAFQQRVWQALRKIPAGKTVSYSEIARRIGSPTATRAVASACAANTLAVAIPCHRVVRNDGKITGYRWGIERKRTLLNKESGE